MQAMFHARFWTVASARPSRLFHPCVAEYSHCPAFCQHKICVVDPLIADRKLGGIGRVHRHVQVPVSSCPHRLRPDADLSHPVRCSPRPETLPKMFTVRSFAFAATVVQHLPLDFCLFLVPRATSSSHCRGPTILVSALGSTMARQPTGPRLPGSRPSKSHRIVPAPADQT